MTSLIPAPRRGARQHCRQQRWPTALASVVVVVASVGGCVVGGKDQASSAGARPESSAQRSRATGATFVLDVHTTAADLDTKSAHQPTTQLTGQRNYRGQLPHGYSAGPLAIDTEGAVLVAINPPVRTGTELPIIGQSTLQWWRGARRSVVSDGKTTRVDAASQAFQASACSAPPVWLETHSVTLDRQDWRIWTRLPGRKQPTLLGSSTKMLAGPDPAPARGSATPVTNGTVAYWPIMRKVKGKDQTAIAGRPLASTAAPRIYATNGISPQVGINGDLLFLRGHAEDARVPIDQVQIRTVSRGTESLVRTVKIPRKTQVTSFIAHGNRMALAVPDTAPFDPKPSVNSTLLIWTEPNRTTTGMQPPAISASTALRVHVHGNGSELAFAGTHLIWGNGSGSGDGGQYLLDVDRRRIYRLASNPGRSYVYACGPYLAWTTVGKGNTVGNFVAARWH